LHLSAYQDAEQFAAKYLLPREPLLIADVGSFDVNGTLKPIFDQENWNYTGYDLSEGKNVDHVLSSPYNWPEIDDGFFDVVISTQVVEHVQHPWRWIKEVARIVKPGGLIYICTPNTIHFHEYPIDCFRVWPDGMRGLFQEAGIAEIECYAKGMDTTGIGRKVAA
jgi:SAM-dependent methyltransferase